MFFTFSYSNQTFERFLACLQVLNCRFVLGEKTGAKNQKVFNVYIEIDGEKSSIEILMQTLARKLKGDGLVVDNPESLIDFINDKCSKVETNM